MQQVTDIDLEEQLYLYERARRFKAKCTGIVVGEESPALCQVGDPDVPEKVENHDATVYLVFMEGSTRTRESLRNAAVYHGVKVNEFQAESSSFQKNETITDTMKMLTVYSTGRSVFVIRSPLEGVCSWLQTAMPQHALKFGLPCPAFLNAGDGRNSHPLGELADIFSLLETQKWDRSVVHLALVGDLAHGRTAHSKVEGLSVFKSVRVDLVAPALFQYPVEYLNKMRQKGYDVRTYDSIEEYFERASWSIAPIWYFYHPQFARCGDLSRGKKEELLQKVTFQPQWLTRKEAAELTFFQTLPRDQDNPLVPLMVDDTRGNGWDRLANNAYYLDVILLSMLFGKIGRGPALKCDLQRLGRDVSVIAEKEEPVITLSGVGQLPDITKEFVQVVDISSKPREMQPERARGSGGPLPISDGLVIDHIGMSSDSKSCWDRLRMVRTILGWGKYGGSEGVFASTKNRGQYKGIMSLPNFEFASGESFEDLHERAWIFKALGCIVPGCTVNKVENARVVAKFRLQVPPRFRDLSANISCKNALCVSHPKNKQRDVVACFERVKYYETSALPHLKSAEFLFLCQYCKWPHEYKDIWVGH